MTQMHVMHVVCKLHLFMRMCSIARESTVERMEILEIRNRKSIRFGCCSKGKRCIYWKWPFSKSSLPSWLLQNPIIPEGTIKQQTQLSALSHSLSFYLVHSSVYLFSLENESLATFQSHKPMENGRIYCKQAILEMPRSLKIQSLRMLFLLHAKLECFAFVCNKLMWRLSVE